MLAATAWDDGDWRGEDAGGWSVMGRLRERQQTLRKQVEAARRRRDEDLRSLKMVTLGTQPEEYEAPLRAKQGGPTVLALLFTYPGSQSLEILDGRGKSFDVRSGTSWDLFFPGYYRSADPEQERRAGSNPVGSEFAEDWFFSPRDFDHLRRHVQNASEDRWKYSGRTDLVLVCAWITPGGEPIIDWPSTISGSLSDEFGKETLTLGEVIERITGDLESDGEDPNFGVAEVTGPDDDPGPGSGATREFIVSVLSGIATSLATGG